MLLPIYCQRLPLLVSSSFILFALPLPFHSLVRQSIRTFKENSRSRESFPSLHNTKLTYTLWMLKLQVIEFLSLVGNYNTLSLKQSYIMEPILTYKQSLFLSMSFNPASTMHLLSKERDFSLYDIKYLPLFARASRLS